MKILLICSFIVLEFTVILNFLFISQHAIYAAHNARYMNEAVQKWGAVSLSPLFIFIASHLLFLPKHFYFMFIMLPLRNVFAFRFKKQIAESQ